MKKKISKYESFCDCLLPIFPEMICDSCNRIKRVDPAKEIYHHKSIEHTRHVVENEKEYVVTYETPEACGQWRQLTSIVEVKTKVSC